MQESIVAIIGTAGRTQKEKYTKELWLKMKEVMRMTLTLNPELTLVSGGAAWSDHLAVWAYNNDLCKSLILHLPAPFDLNETKFLTLSNYEKSAAHTTNYYAKTFSKIIGEDSLSQIKQSILKGAIITEEPHQLGYAPMFARNDKIAKSATHGVIAFSMGGDDTPNSNGTLHTWNKIKSTNKWNINLEKIDSLLSNKED